ncbi:hypothetical protein HUJ04_006018 [Dendroctonus ponderosae]|nr:hypothetical protein HUJ04_006018 [Dendroctonus ponderosae]
MCIPGPVKESNSRLCENKQRIKCGFILKNRVFETRAMRTKKCSPFFKRFLDLKFQWGVTFVTAEVESPPSMEIVSLKKTLHLCNFVEQHGRGTSDSLTSKYSKKRRKRDENNKKPHRKTSAFDIGTVPKSESAVSPPLARDPNENRDKTSFLVQFL